jgi:hypothetical protein
MTSTDTRAEGLFPPPPYVRPAERRLRRLARRNGYTASKSRRSGFWHLYDAAGRSVTEDVIGPGGLTLTQARTWLEANRGTDNTKQGTANT